MGRRVQSSTSRHPASCRRTRNNGMVERQKGHRMNFQVAKQGIYMVYIYMLHVYIYIYIVVFKCVLSYFRKLSDIDSKIDC